MEVKEFEGKIIDDYKKCVDIKMMAYNWIIEEMEPQGGACRWRMFSWKQEFISWGVARCFLVILCPSQVARWRETWRRN